MVESGTATDNVLKYAHWFVLQHSIALIFTRYSGHHC